MDVTFTVIDCLYLKPLFGDCSKKQNYVLKKGT